jgi:phosphopantothenoylcysteine decarboxylase/phosphopantothenate--cysteine ligase
MSEPEEIIDILDAFFATDQPFRGKTFLITAGPTYEAIDPVRFIGNHSSGQMGYQLALKAAEQGARVVLISGPTSLELNHDMIQKVDIVSALEMYEAALASYAGADVVICAAAVADFRPKKAADQKIKKGGELQITLVNNPDILETLGRKKKEQFLVGFALETENEIENATNKLKKKNLDAIVLNSLNDAGAGFGSATNKITFIDKNLEIKAFDLKTKAEVAGDILREISSRINA